jgi:hypothetical protein
MGEGMEAHLDGINDEAIWGWVWDSSQPDTVFTVDIFDGDQKLATVVADVYREDLVNAKTGNNGKHSFKYPTPKSLKDGKSHIIRARIAGTDKELVSTLKPFKVP